MIGRQMRARRTLDRIVSCLMLLFGASLTACSVSLHDNVLHARLPEEQNSLYQILQSRLAKVNMPGAPLAIPASGGDAAAKFLPPSDVTEALHNALIAYSPLAVLTREKATVACLRAIDAKDFEGLQAKVANAKEAAQKIKLGLRDFNTFIKDLNQWHESLKDGTLGPLRLALLVEPPSDPAAERSFLHFLGGYLAAYANGTFVDRDGATLSKPSVDSAKHSINNDTITAFISVLGEAIIDHFFYRYRSCLEFPIVGTEGADTIQWLTVGGGMPTLARVLGLDEKTTKIPTDYLKGIVEPANDDKANGLGPKKLKLIRLVGGVSGDRAKLASGLIVRNFGGMHAGQFVFAKWSIGDNETLSKVAETVFDLLAKRTSESIASRVIYPLNAPPEIDWISQVVGEVVAPQQTAPAK